MALRVRQSFAENAVAKKSIKKTTKDLLANAYTYVIVDAIRDNNVLKFAIEYVGRYQYKDGSNNNLDISRRYRHKSF
ncbi:hypothetical protein O9992_09585 [Vibrio lentus]|nr:hypothetical protein [Vibrio lentus]